MALSWYTFLIGAVAIERFAELVVSQRNLAWSRAQGGVELGAGHYPAMVVLHTGLLIGCLAEVFFLHRPFPALAGVADAGGPVCRPRTSVVVYHHPWAAVEYPGGGSSRRSESHQGPYRVLSHPNYVAVVAEGVALPLVHTAWLTALAFTVLNAALLARRIDVENAALARLT